MFDINHMTQRCGFSHFTDEALSLVTDMDAVIASGTTNKLEGIDG